MDAYYDAIAPGYNKLHGEEQKRKIDRIVKSFVMDGGERVLDVGCGTGLSFDSFENIIGVDPSLQLLKQAKGRVVRGVAENLPFKDDSFDVVISVSAMQNFNDVLAALKEMKRVCKGRFAISFVKTGNKQKVARMQTLIYREMDVQAAIEDENDLIFLARHPQ